MRLLRVLLGLMIALTLEFPALAAGTTEPVMKFNAAEKSVSFQLALGVQGQNHGININGFSNGGVTLTVPLGWEVSIKATNLDTIPHSIEIVTATGTLPSHALTPAFAGAETADLKSGLPPEQSDAFSFKANHIGRYRIVGGVSGDTDGGMWGWLVVSASATEPTVASGGLFH